MPRREREREGGGVRQQASKEGGRETESKRHRENKHVGTRATQDITEGSVRISARRPLASVALLRIFDRWTSLDRSPRTGQLKNSASLSRSDLGELELSEAKPAVGTGRLPCPLRFGDIGDVFHSTRKVL